MDRPKFQIAAACGLAVLLASSGCRGTPSRQVPPEQPYSSPAIAPGGAGFGSTAPAGVNYGGVSSAATAPTADPYNNTGVPATSPYGDYGAGAGAGAGTAPPLETFPTTGAGAAPAAGDSLPAVGPASGPAQYNVGDPGAGPNPL